MSGQPRMEMIVHDTIGVHLAIRVAETAVRAEAAMREGQSELEDYAKRNAPWNDQTGNARAGLNASVGVEGGEIVLNLAHSVDYGVYLELKDDGKYAILLPTIEALGPQILQRAGGTVVR